MSENNNTPIEDEDLELDDFDDDLGDESWDDFDDEIDQPDMPVTTQKNKTFAQKYFYVIIALVVLVGAGLFGGAQFMKNNAPSVTEAQSVMPAPENVEAPALPTGDQFAMLDGEADLPPMPTPMETEIAPPVEEAVMNYDAADTESEPQEKEPYDPLAEIEDTLTPIPGLSDTSEDPEENFATAQNTLEEEEVIALEPLTDEQKVDLLLPPESDTQTTETEANEQPILLETDEARQELEAVTQSLTAEINEKDEMIASLNTMINELQSRIKTLETQATDQNRTESAASPAEPKAPAQKPVPEAQKTQSVKWIMRSAQPGQAMISREGSNDLFSVQIGETIKGLGKITAIEQENDRWVIRGTQNSVTQ